MANDIPSLLERTRRVPGPSLRRILEERPELLDGVRSRVDRVFRDPRSSWASPGPLTPLARAALHIALGRGVDPSGSAFVSGFAMGSATGIENRASFFLGLVSRISHPFDERHGVRRIEACAFEHAPPWNRRVAVSRSQMGIFLWFAVRFGPVGHRYGDAETIAFSIGFDLGGSCRRDAADVAYESYLDVGVLDLRRLLRIRPELLRAARSAEIRAVSALAAKTDAKIDSKIAYKIAGKAGFESASKTGAVGPLPVSVASRRAVEA